MLFFYLCATKNVPSKLMSIMIFLTPSLQLVATHNNIYSWSEGGSMPQNFEMEFQYHRLPEFLFWSSVLEETVEPLRLATYCSTTFLIT